MRSNLLKLTNFGCYMRKYNIPALEKVNACELLKKAAKLYIFCWFLVYFK